MVWIGQGVQGAHVRWQFSRTSVKRGHFFQGRGEGILAGCLFCFLRARVPVCLGVCPSVCLSLSLSFSSLVFLLFAKCQHVFPPLPFPPWRPSCCCPPPALDGGAAAVGGLPAASANKRGSGEAAALRYLAQGVSGGCTWREMLFLESCHCSCCSPRTSLSSMVWSLAHTAPCFNQSKYLSKRLQSSYPRACLVNDIAVCPLVQPNPTGAARAHAPAQQHVELRRVRADGDQGNPQPGPPGGGPQREGSRHGQEAQEEALQALGREGREGRKGREASGTFSLGLYCCLSDDRPARLYKAETKYLRRACLGRGRKQFFHRTVQ